MGRRRKHPNKLPGEVLVHCLGHSKLDWIMHWKASWFLGGCALPEWMGRMKGTAHFCLFGWVSSRTCSPNSPRCKSSPGLSSTCSTGQLLEKMKMLTMHTCINQHPWAAFTPCPWLQHFTAPQSSSYWPIVISTYPRVARTATGHWLSHWCPPWTTVRQHETPTQSFFTGSAASRIFFSTRLHLFFRVSNTQTKAQTPRGASTAINGTMSPTEI